METCYELETFKVKLMVSEPLTEKVREPAAAWRILKLIYADLDADQEHFAVLLLNNKNVLRGYKVISSGSQTSSLIHPALVFRAAILFGACAIIVAHNHPSGDPSPSANDIEITQRLMKCGEVFGLPVRDHLILGDRRYYSFEDKTVRDELQSLSTCGMPPKIERPKRGPGSRGPRGPYNHSEAYLARHPNQR